MKKLLLIAPVLLAACQSGPLYERPENPMADAAFMQEMATMAIPGSEHEYLEKLVGNWNVAAKFFMVEGQPPMQASATAEFAMELGGRYLIQDYKSEFMGQAFEGQMHMGFDNVTQEYISIWRDTWSTRPMISHGSLEENGVLMLEHENIDLMTPEGRPGRFEMEIQSDNKMLFRSYDLMPDGSEVMNMELEYTR